MTENNKINCKRKELEIDLMEYGRKLWASRKLLFKAAGIAVIVGLIFAFTTPQKFTVSVTLAPEMGNSRRSSSLSSIASMLGMGNLSTGADADAINVLLYPDVISSTPFLIDLLDTQVKTMNEEESDTSLIEYLKTEKGSLVGTIMSFPGRAIGGILSLFSDNKEEEEKKQINPFQLTKQEAGIVSGLRKKIMANVDKKTGVTSIGVTMQDPMVAAIVTDTLLSKLKEHIISYRVSKAQEDCKYYEKLYQESKEEYYIAQQAYAKYLDANKNIVLESVKAEQQRLQNEMNLAYQLYNQMAGQLQLSKAKVQEAKPVFAIVEPTTVPLRPSGTSKKMILIGFLFLAVAGTSAWILFGKDMWNKLKEEIMTQPNKVSE